MKTSALREPPVHVVLVDSRGVVLDVSTKAGQSEVNSKAALTLYPVGKSYLDLCEDERHVALVQMLLRRKRSLISFVLPSRPKRKPWFVVIGVPVSADVGSGAVLMHVDIAAWVAGPHDEESAKSTKPPMTLNPSLIQDTMTRVAFSQFGPGFGESAPKAPYHPDVDTLSPRQREVLMLLAAGKTNAQIAEELACSLNTVKRHVTAVLQKLRMPNRTSAARIANQLNYAQSDE